MIDASEITDWIPARVSWQRGEPLVDWCYLGEQRTSEVNFDQTLSKCIELPFNLLFRHQTSMEFLRRVDEARPCMKPAGFIFHSTRSGSRLLMRTLAASPTNIVLSEARPIDSLLRTKRFDPSVTEAQRVEWLRLMVSCLARPSGEGERNLFITFHSWNIFELRIIRLAFPDVPWIFVYRDPIEELVSQMKQRDAHMIPGVIDPQVFGMDHVTILEMDPEDYCARVLQALCEAALQNLPDRGLLINSSQLPDDLSTISRFFHLSWTDAEVEIMKSKTKHHSKDPSRVFHEDSARKQAQTSEQLVESARRWLYPVYEKLESARLRGRVTGT